MTVVIPIANTEPDAGEQEEARQEGEMARQKRLSPASITDTEYVTTSPLALEDSLTISVGIEITGGVVSTKLSGITRTRLSSGT